MNTPPPGDDNGNMIPQHRLKFLLGQFEDELSKIQVVFQQHLPGQFHTQPTSLEHSFSQLRVSAEELGSDYPFLVERLIADYEHFRDEPSQDKLAQLFQDVQNLQLLLVG